MRALEMLLMTFLLMSTALAHGIGVGEEEHVMHDISRLEYTDVYDIVTAQEISTLQEYLERAHEEELKVSIAGARHSMGGHTFFEDALVVDMTEFDDVLWVDAKRKIVRVQAGAYWSDVIQAIEPYNLSVTVMQAYSGFSIGGSASVNVHESDPRYGPMIETVDSFRLLLANGTLINVSREENQELFSLVQGGYGLFGIITDMDLSLTDNKLYKKTEFFTNKDDYLQDYRDIQANKSIENIFSRLDISRGDGFLQDMIVTTYSVAPDQQAASWELYEPPTPWFKEFIFDLSRSYEWGKELRWYLQKEYSDKYEPPYVTRNNLDLNDLGFLSYYSYTDTDILQEYFVPVDDMPEFVEYLKTIMIEYDANLLSATVRWVPENNESVLTYSPQESFGIVLYFNVGTSEKQQAKVQEWSRKLIDKANSLGGTYYLPYVKYASQEQIRTSYPALDHFFERKKAYDTKELFYNEFYDYYAYP